MKKINFIVVLLLASFFVVTSCQDEDKEFGDVTAPTNLVVNFQIQGQDAENPNGDGSGIVTFQASADNAITYRYNYGDNTDVESAPSGETSHRFTRQGINTYNVTLIASGTGGVTSSSTVSITVESAFDDVEARSFLSGAPISQDEDGNDIINIDMPVSKTWYFATDQDGHYGVGPSLDFDIEINGQPSQYYFPAFFAAPANSTCESETQNCLCDDELIFTLDENNNLTFVLDNKGGTLFNEGHQEIVGGDGSAAQCFDFDTSGVKNVSVAPAVEDWSLVPDPSFEARGTSLTYSDQGFMGYYVTSFQYEIIEVTEDYLYVRCIDGLNPILAWYMKFTTTPPGSGSNDLTEVTVFNNLVWDEEFDVDGAPDAAVWSYDLGTGSNGWGNAEEQYYTDRSDNVKVENGNLIITAKAESFEGEEYTSARIKSQDAFDFTYGRVEINAKLPEGGGTWPALWMLGSNFTDVGWPECGEIDIMEHRGNVQNEIKGTLHFPGNFAGNAIGGDTVNSTASTDFHLYSVEWTETQILFAVDNQIYFTFTNNESLPFNNDFFLILNVAMGGTFGGDIDPSFTESSMEVDYIRVYQ